VNGIEPTCIVCDANSVVNVAILMILWILLPDLTIGGPYSPDGQIYKILVLAKFHWLNF